MVCAIPVPFINMSGLRVCSEKLAPKGEVRMNLHEKSCADALSYLACSNWGCKHPFMKLAGVIRDVITRYLSIQHHQQNWGMSQWLLCYQDSVDLFCWYFRRSQLTLGRKPMSALHLPAPIIWTAGGDNFLSCSSLNSKRWSSNEENARCRFHMWQQVESLSSDLTS